MNIDSGCFTFCQIQGARNAASLTTELAPSRTCGCKRAIAPSRVQPRRRTFGSREKVPPVLVRASMVSFQAAWALQPRTSGFKRLTPAAVPLNNEVGSYIVKGRGARGCRGSCRSMLPGDVVPCQLGCLEALGRAALMALAGQASAV